MSDYRDYTLTEVNEGFWRLNFLNYGCKYEPDLCEVLSCDAVLFLKHLEAFEKENYKRYSENSFKIFECKKQLLSL